MDEEPVTIPDFLPVTFQDEYRDDARRQVEDSRLQRPEPAMGHPRAATGNEFDPQPHPQPQRAVAAAPVQPRGRRLPHWLAAAELPMAVAATLIGLIGVAALTAMWGWFAVTQDPMWWAFAGVGAALFVGLSVVAGVLHRRSCVLIADDRRQQPAGHSEETPAPA